VKKLICIFIFALVPALAFPLLKPAETHALSGNDFHAGRIIDDGIFYNNTVLTTAQIQQFLNAKVPACDTNGDQPYGGSTRRAYAASRSYSPPFTCLKDYRQDAPSKAAEPGLCNAMGAGNKSSAEIISEISNVCGINPEVLLVLLQKEQSLITDDWPWSIQYRSATGYGCPDTAPCDADYYGFFNQVYNAARQFKRYARDANLFQYRAGRDNYIQYNPNAGCGGTNVNIQNQATANLYNYTPYQPNPSALANLYGTGDGCGAYGNRNFWRMFNDWFGTTTGTPLVRTPSSPTYYLITNGQRFAIPNGDILYAYGLERTELTYVSDGYLATIPDGGVLSTIFTLPGDPTVYLADGNKRYGIASGAYCTKWGLACGNTNVQKELGAHISNTMYDGGVLQDLMANQGAVYKMEDGKKLPFFSEKALTDRGYTLANAIGISNFTNAIRPIGLAMLENNSIVKFASGSGIYAYTNNNFYSFPSMETYRDWSGGNIKTFVDSISTYNQNIPASAGSVESYITFGNGVNYLVDGGQLVNIGAQTSDWPAASNVSYLGGFGPSMPTKATLSIRSTVRLQDGSIYKTQSLKKLPFGGIYDYFGLGYTTSDIVQLNTNTVSTVPIGTTLLAEARLIKKQNSDLIYATGPNNTLYVLSSLNQLEQYKFDTTNVPRVSNETAALYTNEAPLISVISTDGGVYVVSHGERLLIPASLSSQYNTSALQKILFANNTLSRLPNHKALDRFLQNDGGTIYYVENGFKRPIKDYATFRQLGGNNLNTHNVPADFLNQLPTGSVL
jgi:hypothetical protein